MAKSVDAYAVADGDLDLRSLGAALWRRKLWIILPTLLVAIGAGVVVNLMTPRYKSEARIVYDGRENVFLRPDAEKSLNQDRGPADPETLTDQVQIVLSRELALAVIANLKLNETPEFEPVLRGQSVLHQILVMAGLSRDLLAMSPEERVLESWYDRLTAYSVDKSRVIVIEFQATDPALAARITNAIAAEYLRRQQFVRQEQTRGAGQWLANEIDGLRRKVADAETKAEAFRGDTNLMIGTNNTTLSGQQLGEINSQFAAALGQKADAETRARIIREMLRQGGSIEASDVVNSELIRRLSEQRVILRGQLAEQSSTLLDGHPRIKELRAQIADLDHQIRAEAEKLARTFDSDARIATARLDAMTNNLNSFKRQAASANEKDVEYRALEREAKAQRDLLESYLAKYRETTARETIGTAPPDAKIISAAIVSNTPAFPRKVPIIAIATLLAFVMSSGLVTTRELMRAVAGPVPVARRESTVSPEPIVEREAVVEPERTVEPERAVEARYAVERQCAVEPEPTVEPEHAVEEKHAVERQRVFEARYAVEPEPAVEPEHAVEAEHAVERQRPFEARYAVERQRAVEPEPAVEPEHTVEAEHAVERQRVIEAERAIEPEHAIEPEPAVAPEPVAPPAEPVAEAPALDAGAPVEEMAPPAVPHPALGLPLNAVRDVARRLRENADIGHGVALFGARPEIATTLPALTLARSLATDAKVIVVGLVKGAPVLEAIAASPDMPGLSDAIRGASPFGQIIGKDRLSRVHLIRYGRSDMAVEALLASRQFAVMMQALSRAYHHVIIDAGTLSGDCFLLAPVAPRAVLIAPDNAPQEITAEVEMLTGAGFADIAIMSSVVGAGASPNLAAA